MPQHHMPPRLSFTFSVPAINLAYLWARLSRTCQHPWLMVHILGVRSLDWPGELRAHETAFLPIDVTLGH